MVEEKVKRVGYEWRGGEDSKVLHLSVKMPRATVPEELGIGNFEEEGGDSRGKVD
jgi:hypothetical protein